MRRFLFIYLSTGILTFSSTLFNIHAVDDLLTGQQKSGVGVTIPSSPSSKNTSVRDTYLRQVAATKAQLRACVTFYQDWASLYENAAGSNVVYVSDALDGVGKMRCLEWGDANIGASASTLLSSHLACSVSAEGIGTCPSPWLLSLQVMLIDLEQSWQHTGFPLIVEELKNKFPRSSDGFYPRVACISDDVYLAQLGCEAELRKRGE